MPITRVIIRRYEKVGIIKRFISKVHESFHNRNLDPNSEELLSILSNERPYHDKLKVLLKCPHFLYIEHFHIFSMSTFDTNIM